MDSFTRNFLRKRAHELKPIVMVGKSGMSDSVEMALEEALSVHELVKVKFFDFKETRRDIAQTLAEHTRSELIQVIGNIAILYREHEDPSMRRYHAPKRS
ncbi:MAG: YhbY family RNA-binding protein [Spirochaetia bacterium]|nr:YhbY family RNA-binding protein [Spirochaetia bacterium]